MPDEARRTTNVCIISRGCYSADPRAARDARALRDDGCEVHVVCLRGAGEPAREVIDGVTVHRGGGSPAPGRTQRAFFLRASFTLFSLFLRHRFDAIQADNPPDSLVFVALLPRIFGARVVLRMTEPVPERIASMPPRWYTGARVAIARTTRRAAIAFAHRAVVSHREVREACAEDGADVNRIAVVVDGVPDAPALRPEYYDDRRAEIAAARRDERRRGEFRIVWIGGGIGAGAGARVGAGVGERVGAGPGTADGGDVLVRAVAVLRAGVPRVIVRIVGVAAPAVERALTLAAEVGVGAHVQAAGELSLEGAAVELLEADVVVEPSRRTPWTALVPPPGVFECASLRRLLVASRLESITSYFAGESVVTFTPGDADDLARALHHVFAHPEETSARVGAAARVVETHRWEREAKKYVGVFHSLPGWAPRA